MTSIYQFGFMGLAVFEVDTEMTVKIVVFHNGRAMRHAIHGCSVYMAVVLDENSSAIPGPASAKDAVHDFGVLGGGRFRIQVVGAGPADGGEGFASADILDGKLGIFRNHFCHVFGEPIRCFGFDGFCGGLGGGSRCGSTAK